MPIGQRVQFVPPRAADACDHAVRRSQTERSHHDEGDETDRQIKPEHDLAGDGAEREILVDHIKKKMRQRIEESGDPERAAHVDELRCIKQAPRRRDAERQEQESHRPLAGLMREFHQRLRAEILVDHPAEQIERRQAGARKGDELVRGEFPVFLAPGMASLGVRFQEETRLGRRVPIPGGSHNPVRNAIKYGLPGGKGRRIKA